MESVPTEVQAAIDTLMYAPTSQEADTVRFLHALGDEDATVESLIEQLGGDPYIEQAIHLTYATIDALLKRGLVSHVDRVVQFLPTVASVLTPTIPFGEAAKYPIGAVVYRDGELYEHKSEGEWVKSDWFP
jgi:hypothetical protein